MPAMRPPHDRGFTLVEILIVVIILGILSAIVLPQFSRADDDARRTVFIRNLKHFQQGISLHHAETDTPLTDGSSGQCPVGLKPFVRVDSFERPTPLGGLWDVEANDSGIILAVGVHFDGTGMTRSDAYMQPVDAQLDDGNLATGNFRKLADGRFYWVLEE